jgi:hypothetical protein
MQRSITKFYLLAIGFAWLGWIPTGASQAGILPLQMPIELQVATQFGPSLAALLLTGLAGGFSGVKRFLGACLRWRIGLRWYALALLLSPAIGAFVIAVHSVLGHEVPGWSDFARLHASYVESLGGPGPYHVDQTAQPSLGLIALETFAAKNVAGALAVFVVVGVLTGPISEEFGWRGYAQPALQSRYGVMRSAITVGVLWGMWHTGPDFWRLLLEGRLTAFLLPLWITLGTIPLSVLFAWMFNRTAGSVIPAMLCHASFNSTLSVLALVWPERPSLLIATDLGAGIWILAIVVVIADRSVFLSSRKSVVTA